MKRYRGEKQTAYEAALRCYCRMAIGEPPPNDLGYHGDFDFSWLEVAPVPGSGRVDEQRACWQEFRRLFDEQWTEQKGMVSA